MKKYDSAPPPVVTALSLGPCPDLREVAARYLEEYVGKIHVFIAEMDEEILWQRPQENANSIGNLLLHLVGNLELWINNSLGGGSYARDRGAEFSTRSGPTAETLMQNLEDVVRRCRLTLQQVPSDGLQRHRDVQGYSIDDLGIIFHAVEHMSYHTGQIAWAVKASQDLSRQIELYPHHRGE